MKTILSLGIGILLLTSGCRSGNQRQDACSRIYSYGPLEQWAEGADEVHLLTNYQPTVTAMEALLAQHKSAPEHLYRDDVPVTNAVFDIMRVFDLLKHIQPVTGHRLDYVYCRDKFAGLPVLYMRKVDAPSYRSYKEYADDHQKPRPGSGGDVLFPYLRQIRKDGTPESYMDLLTLTLLADQFYLWWHAGYKDDQLVCDATRMRQLLTEWNESKKEDIDRQHKRLVERDTKPEHVERWLAKQIGTDPTFKYLELSGITNALTIDPLPRVVFHGTEVTVQYLYASELYGGLTRAQWTVTRDPPHVLLRVRRETVVNPIRHFVF